MDEESVFFEAIKRQSPKSRAEYLAKACAGNADLRAGVEELLRKHDQVDSLLDAPVELVESPDTEGTQLAKSPRTRIGPYKLLQEIGRGGFGVVYMAEQIEPIRRKVALKIIKPGMDTEDIIARFDAERQAVALMDHPNIAKILDAGSTDAGRPYFVMELVKGVPINEYCDSNNLTTQQRLELFIQVCRAVQHAHQKAVIHRDIKPTNILVTLHDGQPVPKMIDFGVAKALNQQLTEQTLFTRYGQMIGTPQYMSPEQAEMSGLDVDTRSDVYSLGVVLYELLTGRPPFKAETLREAGFDEVRRIIREEEPAKPSFCVRTLDNESATNVATHRSIAPQALSRLLHGDLDWVVMKSLEKDRTKRYETASEFADNVMRYINHEPVDPRPSSLQLIRKLYQRNRRMFGVAATLLAAIVLGGALSFERYLHAEKQNKIAQQATREAKEQKKIAETNEEKARESLHQLVDLLTESDRDSETGKPVTVPDLLDRLASGLEEQFRGYPDLEADLHLALARSLLARGESSATLVGKPAKHLARARELFDENTPQHAECLRYLGLLKRDMVLVQKAAKIESALNGGSADYQTLSVLGYLSYVADSQNEMLDLRAQTRKYLQTACDEFDESSPPRLFEELPFLWMSVAEREAGNTDQYDWTLARSREIARNMFPQRGESTWTEKAKSKRIVGAQCLDIAELCLQVSTKDMTKDTRPEWHYVYVSQGRSLPAKQRLQKLAVDRAGTVGPASSTHTSLGRVRYHLGDFSGAIAHLENAIAVLEMAGVSESEGEKGLRFRYAYFNFELALLLAHENQDAQAKEHLRKASAFYGDVSPDTLKSFPESLYILLCSLVLAGDPVDEKWLDPFSEEMLSSSLRMEYRAIPYAANGLIYEVREELEFAMSSYENYLLFSAGWGYPAFYQDVPQDRLFRLYRETDSINRAVRFLKQLVAARDKNHYRGHPRKGLSRVDIARFLIEVDREPELAKTYLTEARQILKDYRARSLIEIKHKPELAELEDSPAVPQRIFDEIEELLEGLE